MAPDPDAAILSQALAGEPAQLAELVDRWTPVIQARVVRTLRRVGYRWDERVRQEIEEFVQQVFVSMFENGGEALRAWDRERGLSLDNWVGLIAERQVLSLVRTKKRNPWTEEPVAVHELDGIAEQPDPEEEAITRDVLRRLLERLQEQLSPLGWHLFRLLYVDQLSVEAAVTTSGLTASAIYAWRSRLRRLARQLGKDLLSENRAAARTPDQG